MSAAHDHERDHVDSGSLRPKAARLEDPESALQMRAALSGLLDAVTPPGVLRLQRAVGNAGTAALLARERSPVHDVISRSGEPLAHDVREDMEGRLGHDFHDVRVHSDGAADASARSVNANAYTVGSHVVFQRSAFDPGSHEGSTTLAHELTHVVQQRTGPVDGTPGARGISVSDSSYPSDRFEREAATTAERAMATPAAAAPSTAPAPVQVPVQRQAAGKEPMTTSTGRSRAENRDRNATPARRAPTPSAGAGLGSARSLALQRSVGNSTVATMIVADRPSTVLQRQAPPDKSADRKFRQKFTYPFWNLKEGKGVKPEADDSVVLLINGVRVRLLPDRFASEDELKKQGETFEGEGKSLPGAVTRWNYAGMTWDPKSVKHEPMGSGQWMVVDYVDPVVEVSVQVTYRKSKKAPSLSAARGLRSAYGKGGTLKEHERSHVEDGISYARANGPVLGNGRGQEANEFNAQFNKFKAAALDVGTDIAAYSRARTDCPGKRNAAFCKAK